MHILVLSSASIVLVRIETSISERDLCSVEKRIEEKGINKITIIFTLYFHQLIDKDCTQHDKRSTTLLFVNMTKTVCFWGDQLSSTKKKKYEYIRENRIYLIKLIDLNTCRRKAIISFRYEDKYSFDFASSSLDFISIHFLRCSSIEDRTIY